MPFVLKELVETREGETMYAHSIKNPHIIHFRREWHEDEYHFKDDDVYRYLCCNCYTPEKATDESSKVTCKNCLKILSEMET